MIHQPESRATDRPIAETTHRREIPRLNLDQLAKQETQFESSLAQFRLLLQPEHLAESLAPLVQELLSAAQLPNAEVAAATEFFALASAAEEVRTKGRHIPSWRQAEAALYACYCHDEPKVQKIEMPPGEGKTFTIALVSAWRVLRGETVSVYTDKQLNVEQSMEATAPLYQLLGVTAEQIQTQAELGSEAHLQYLLQINELPQFAQDPSYRPQPKVRYGVWSHFIHEFMARQDLIAIREAVIAGDTDAQRRLQAQRTAGAVPPPTPEEAQQMERLMANFTIELQWLRLLERPNAVLADEGDDIDLESSPVVLTEPVSEAYQEQQEVELHLIWDFITARQRPETLAKMAEAVGFSLDEVRELFQLDEEVVTEGFQSEAASISRMPVRVEVNLDKVYIAKLFEWIVEPDRLSQMAQLAQLHGDEFQSEVLDQQDIEFLAKSFSTHSVQDAKQVDWLELAAVLSPPTTSDLQLLFDPDGLLIRPNPGAVEPHQIPIVQDIIAREPSAQISSEELELLGITQLLTVVRLCAFADEVMGPAFQHYVSTIYQTQLEYVEGDNYQIVTGPDGVQTVEVIGQDRQPEKGKRFAELTDLFLRIKHGLPLSTMQRVQSRMLPVTWFRQLIQKKVKVSSLSGTQDDPDFVVPPSGEGEAFIHRTRVFPNQEQKRQALIAFAQQCKDRPVVICSQDGNELLEFQQQIQSMSKQEVILLTAQQAENATELVGQLEKGKILLLHITSRGLNIGRFLEEVGRHSFENGVVISAHALPETHARDQQRGRVGNRRASGNVFEFDAMDGKVSQQRAAYQPGLAVERQKRFDRLENVYQRVVSASSRTLNLNWPAHFSEAMAVVDLWEEAVDLRQLLETEKSPAWLGLFNSQLPHAEQMVPLRDELGPTCQTLRHEYERLRSGHVRTIAYQQELNMKQVYIEQQRQLVIDQAMQVVRNVLLHPDLTTPLGRVVKRLSYEDRIGLMARVFEEGDQLFALSVRTVPEVGGASDRSQQERRFAQFLKDLTEEVIKWAEKVA